MDILCLDAGLRLVEDKSALRLDWRVVTEQPHPACTSCQLETSGRKLDLDARWQDVQGGQAACCVGTKAFFGVYVLATRFQGRWDELYMGCKGTPRDP